MKGLLANIIIVVVVVGEVTGCLEGIREEVNIPSSGGRKDDGTVSLVRRRIGWWVLTERQRGGKMM